jgi:hypothetical protein
VLKAAVQQYRGKCWRRISTHLPGKTEVRMQNDYASTSSSFLHFNLFFIYNRVLSTLSIVLLATHPLILSSLTLPPSHSPLALNLLIPLNFFSITHTISSPLLMLFLLYSSSYIFSIIHRMSHPLHLSTHTS